MNGIRFYRKKNKLAVYELSEMSHVDKVRFTASK